MHEHLNFHRTNRSFELHKWPKKHQFCVEECNFLNINDVLGHLNILHQQYPSADFLSEYPWLTIVKGRGGFCEKYWFQCPICSCRCENLYREPDSVPEDWGCRKCRNLIYASQRFGPRNSLRQVLTPRKKLSRQKAAICQNRKFSRREAKRKKLRQKHEVPIVDKNFIPMMKEMEKFIASGGSINLKVESRNFEVPVNPHQDEIESMLDDDALEAKSILENLAVNGKTRSIREEARRTLDRGNKIRTVPPASSISLTADQIEWFKKVLAELPEEDLRF